jgi:outer membrane phospholipase A
VLSHQESSVPVTADRVDPDEAFAVLDAGGYTKALYAFYLPASVTGAVRLSVPELKGAGMMFEVQTKDPAFGTTATGPELVELNGEILDLSVFINAYQPYARNISFYQPMYFLFGLDPEETKFQISFKYRFFNPEQPFALKYPWIPNFFFGYTQTSFWDLDTDSRPFEDTSYKPELFFQSTNIDTGIPWIRGLFVQAGFEHESNGNSGDRSRSTNYIYLEPSIIFLKRAELIGLRIAPKFWAYVNNSNRTNPDLYAYRGYYSLRLTFGQANSIICDTHWIFAEKGSSVKVDLTYPLHRLLRGNFDFYLHLQYVNALGESLLNYTDRTEGVRIGLAIVR